ncbi:hypothetical protein Btru_000156 [Bulinus truncatus]|nr:hypothetical protein Btru_000156 [Bulinus truncatus]
MVEIEVVQGNVINGRDEVVQDNVINGRDEVAQGNVINGRDEVDQDNVINGRDEVAQGNVINGRDEVAQCLLSAAMINVYYVIFYCSRKYPWLQTPRTWICHEPKFRLLLRDHKLRQTSRHCETETPGRSSTGCRHVMPAAAIAMTTSKMSPLLASGGSMSTISIPVSAYHDPANNVITITPYILLKTTTVAEQMQALRQEKKIGKAPEPPTGALRVKRRADLSKLGLPEPKPASVSRRNARERNRVKQVNQGFETLREHVPNGKKNKKMSKVQTLRSAAQYIKDLYMILHGELPALGSPNVVDEHDPDSPLDSSDIEMSVSSPESHVVTATTTAAPPQHVSQQQVCNNTSPTTVICQQPHQQQQLSPQAPETGQLRPKAVPLILKKEQSVLHQQLVRVLQQTRSPSVHQQTSSPSVLKQQLQAQHLVQAANYQVHQHQLRLALQNMALSPGDNQQSHANMEANYHHNNCQMPIGDVSDTMAVGDMDNDSDSSLHSAGSPLTYTQLSPIPPHVDSDRSDDVMVPDYSDLLNNNPVKLTPSPPSGSDVNMNLVSSEFSHVQNFFKSLHHERHLQSDLSRTINFLHSPAPSLSSTGSTSSSELSAVYDCENDDKEALLDISNWITELCSHHGVNDLVQN